MIAKKKNFFFLPPQTLEELEAGAAAGADVAQLVLHAKLRGAGGRVAASDDGRHAPARCRNHGIHHAAHHRGGTKGQRQKM